MERASLYPETAQAETAVNADEKLLISAIPPSSPEVENASPSRPISQRQLINKLNYLNFLDKPLYVNFRHKQNHRALSIKAKPQPCQDNRLTCMWQQDAGNIVDHPDFFCFQNILIPDGKRFLVAEPDVLEISKQTIRLILPETCSAADARSTRRHVCRDINVYVTQNGALFYGSMIDFSAFSFRVQVQTKPPQTFDWIDANLAVNVILFDGNKTLYSGECRIVKQTHGHGDRCWVLEPVRRNIRRFRPKEFRSDRCHMVPFPTITFSHPFSKQTTSIDVVNLSGSGLAVEEEYGQAVLFPGLIIPELEIRFGDGSYATCTAQIIYSKENDGGSAARLLRCGIAILDMPIEDHIKVLALLHQVNDKNAHVCNRVNLDKLWKFFFETGFIYPEKYEFIEKNKTQIKQTYLKLYSESPKIARHFIYQKTGRILGHVAMLRFYQRTWLIHHHAAMRSTSNKSGLVVLNQIGLFANDSHRLNSLKMQYLGCFYRPNNKFPTRVFGGAKQSINNNDGCSTDTFAYFHQKVSPPKNVALPAGWQLRSVSTEDLLDLQSVYEKNAGGLMLRAMGLEVDADDFNDLANDYRTVGLIRDRHLFALEKYGELKAVIMVNLSDLGLNMSDLTNSITIFILNRTGLFADIIHCISAQLAKHFNQPHLPVLLHPSADAAVLQIQFEKEYVFWALNTDYGDGYFRYIKRLLKFIHY